MRQTTRGPQPVAVGIQPTTVRPPSQDQNVRLQSALSDQLDALNAASETEKKANMQKGAGGIIRDRCRPVVSEQTVLAGSTATGGNQST